MNNWQTVSLWCMRCKYHGKQLTQFFTVILQHPNRIAQHNRIHSMRVLLQTGIVRCETLSETFTNYKLTYLILCIWFCIWICLRFWRIYHLRNPFLVANRIIIYSPSLLWWSTSSLTPLAPFITNKLITIINRICVAYEMKLWLRQFQMQRHDLNLQRCTWVCVCVCWTS